MLLLLLLLLVVVLLLLLVVVVDGAAVECLVAVAITGVAMIVTPSWHPTPNERDTKTMFCL